MKGEGFFAKSISKKQYVDNMRVIGLRLQIQHNLDVFFFFLFFLSSISYFIHTRFSVIKNIVFWLKFTFFSYNHQTLCNETFSVSFVFCIFANDKE